MYVPGAEQLVNAERLAVRRRVGRFGWCLAGLDPRFRRERLANEQRDHCVGLVVCRRIPVVVVRDHEPATQLDRLDHRHLKRGPCGGRCRHQQRACTDGTRNRPEANRLVEHAPHESNDGAKVASRTLNSSKDLQRAPEQRSSTFRRGGDWFPRDLLQQPWAGETGPKGKISPADVRHVGTPRRRLAREYREPPDKGPK